MSHEISTTNGVASFADSKVDKKGRVDAWHKLGTPVGHAMTAEEALDAAHLSNWNVRKVPLWADIRNDDFYSGTGSAALKVPGQYATVFNNPVTKKIAPLGVVGERYTPIDNEAMAEFSDALVAESGAHYETAGSLRNYTQTFLTMKLPQTFILEGKEGQDITEYYLGLFNSHDGSTGLFGIITPVRVVCANTAGVAIAGAHSRFSVPHTAGWANAVEAARAKLGLTLAYKDSFEAEVHKLFEAPFTVEEMKSFTEKLVDLDKAEKGSQSATKRQNVANGILKLFVESPTIKGTPTEGTAYGAFNAVTEYVDHFSTVRGGGENQEEARATRTLTLAASGTTNSLKADAWSMLRN